jgi:peroxiredoxin
MFGNKYNYARFERSRFLRNLASNQFGGGPRPGEPAPDFEARTLEGERIRLKDFRGRKNVVLTFGSASCPQTAASLPALNDLYESRERDVEFFLVYVREAHPGERIPAHQSNADKLKAAERLRDSEEVEIPIVVDDISGKIHRKYGLLPNPTFIIDKSGRIAFRSFASRASVIADALEELREAQQDGEKHVIVHGGEDTAIPSLSLLVRAHRALERGGASSIENFGRELGLPGRLLVAGSRAAKPIVENSGKIAAGVAASAIVLGLGIWGGLALRRKRLSTYRSPYESRRFQRSQFGDTGDYAVGI